MTKEFVTKRKNDDRKKGKGRQYRGEQKGERLKPFEGKKRKKSYDEKKVGHDVRRVEVIGRKVRRKK